MRRKNLDGGNVLSRLSWCLLLLTSIGCARQADIAENNGAPEAQPSLDKAREESSKGANSYEVAAAEHRKKRLAEFAAGHAPTAESLQEVVLRWEELLVDEDTETRVAAVKAISPSREDVATLFPVEHREKLARICFLRQRLEQLRERDRTLNNLRRSQESIEDAEASAVNLREIETGGWLEETLEMMVAQPPVYGVAMRYKSGITPSRQTFIYINGRWIYWDDLHEVAEETIRVTDEEIQEIEQRVAEREAVFAAKDTQPARKESIGDIHYGLLVYVDKLDEHVSLGPASRFVRAVHRREGQELPARHEKQEADHAGCFTARVERFGRNLRQAMSDEERSRFEALIEQGYVYGVESLSGSVDWRSRHALAGGVRLTSHSTVSPNTYRLEYSKPVQPPPADFDLPEASVAAKLLAIEDFAVARSSLYYLAKVDVDPRCRKEILDALITAKKGSPLKHPQNLPAVFTRWTTKEDTEELERMLAEGQLGKTNLMRVFLRLGKFDEQRAAELLVRRQASIGTAHLADYEFAASIARLVIVQERILPELFAERRYFGDFEEGEIEVDKTELESLYAAVVMEFLKSGDDDHLTQAANLIDNHFPSLKAQAIPYLKKGENYSYAYQMAVRFESDLRSEPD